MSDALCPACYGNGGWYDPDNGQWVTCRHASATVFLASTPPDRPSPASEEQVAQLAFHRRQAENILAATGVVKHTHAADCVGCGCMSLSAEEAVAELIGQHAAALTAVRSIPRRQIDALTPLGYDAGYNAALDAVAAALDTP